MRRTLALWLTALAAVTLAPRAALAAVPAPPRTPPLTYLALGASISVGVQPLAHSAHVRRTDHGYANDLVRLLTSQGVRVRLVQLGCPGETVTSFVSGHDSCYRAHAYRRRRPTSGVERRASQLASARSFLTAHRTGPVLVSLDLGFNDVAPCLRGTHVRARCVTGALKRLSGLVTIVRALRRADPAAHLIGLDHYDPYVAAYRHAAPFATHSVRVFDRLNARLDAIYRRADVAVVPVPRAFGAGPHPRLRTLAARACALTFMCRLGEPPNIHPRNRGYWDIAHTIESTLDRLGLSGPVPYRSSTHRRGGTVRPTPRTT